MMRFAVVVFACVLAAASAQNNQYKPGQYFPQRDQYQYNRYNQYNQYNRYNPYNNNNNYNNYNRYQNYNPYKPYVSSTPFPRPAVTIAEASASVTPAPAAAVTPVVPVVTAVPFVPVSVAKVASDSRSAETVKYGNEVNPDGSYNYYYETNNGIAAQAQGVPRNFGGEPPVAPSVAQGSFSWISPEGQTIAITYVADENGYQPSGDAIPQPPPLPPQIARALEYTAKYHIVPLEKSQN